MQFLFIKSSSFSLFMTDYISNIIEHNTEEIIFLVFLVTFKEIGNHDVVNNFFTRSNLCSKC